MALGEIIKVAMPKGRIYKQAAAMFREAGLYIPNDVDESRKLVIPLPEIGMEFIMAKPVDVPTYVEYGVADIGIVGKDVLMEENRDVYELLDLGIARCRMSVIALPEWKPGIHQRVATKYRMSLHSISASRGSRLR